jgi:hypothetical protein
MRHSISLAALASVLMIAGASAQQTQQTKPQGQTGVGIAVTQPPEALREIRAAIRELREASVLLLNQKDAGADREKAVESAQDAIIAAQRAMAMLPVEYRIADAKTREAKDWPMAAARLDRATLALERALDQIEKTDANKRGQAVTALNKAMDETREALMALPEWTPGAGSPAATGTTRP